MDTGTKWVLAQLAVFLLIAIAFVLFGGEPVAATTVVALVLFVLGQAMALAAAWQMRQYITAHPAPAPGAAMLDRGVYGLVRHPMYGGVMLMVVSIAVYDRNLVVVVLAALLAAVFVGKSRYEESLLAAAFLGYAEYSRRVNRRFLPWLI